MASELYFFTGENTYAMEKVVLRWKQSFCQKYGDENFLLLQAKDCSLSDILDAVSAMPFIADKRLVLIRGIPKIEKDDAKTIVENIHPQVIVAFVESKPDKRLGVVKVLLELSEVKESKQLSPNELVSWARLLVQAEGGSIDRQSLSMLQDIVGSDQWTLQSELRKLVLYAPGGRIEAAHIDALSVPSGDQVVWKLTDLIGQRHIDEALLFLNRRLERGEDPYGLWVILLNMVRNVTLVWAGVQEGLSDKGIASAFDISFYAVRGLRPLATSLGARRIRQLVAWAADADIAVKTGGYRYSAENQEEIIALTEKGMLMCR